MFDSPRWIEATGTVAFRRMAEVIAKAGELGTHFGSFYDAPTVLQMPKDLAPELPRLVFSSKGRNSQISVSQVAASLQVRFSPDWQAAPEKAREYVQKRMELLRGALAVLGNPTPHFTGVSYLIHLPARGTDAEVVRTLQVKSLAREADPRLFDVELKEARIAGGFFENVTVKNYRQYQVELSPDVLRLPESKANERGIAILVDFNDRRAFNEDEGYLSTEDALGEVLKGALECARRAVTLFTEER